VVVVVGETTFEAPVTVPTPLLMKRLVAPAMDQERVEEPPETIEPGEALKEEIVGTVPPPPPAPTFMLPMGYQPEESLPEMASWIIEMDGAEVSTMATASE
jgi:hypothetical protein